MTRYAGVTQAHGPSVDCFFGHVAGIGACASTPANNWRDLMLSHHELATLLLIRDADAPIQMIDSDFLALQRYRLVEMDEAGGDPTLRLTTR
ncbi:hypothetical protein ACLFKT_31955, partial [Paraburkholderia sp. BR14261]